VVGYLIERGLGRSLVIRRLRDESYGSDLLAGSMIGQLT
jgi:hypothetical protein